MAAAPPNPWRITGTPSLGEVPSGGARAFGLLLRFSKVTPCKSGTNSGRYRSNGYVLGLIQHSGRLSGRHRGQVESSHRPSHIWIAVHQLDSYKLPGSKLPCRGAAAYQSCVDTHAPIAVYQPTHWVTDTLLSGACPLPHLALCLFGEMRYAIRICHRPFQQIRRQALTGTGTEQP